MSYNNNNTDSNANLCDSLGDRKLNYSRDFFSQQGRVVNNNTLGTVTPGSVERLSRTPLHLKTNYKSQTIREICSSSSLSSSGRASNHVNVTRPSPLLRDDLEQQETLPTMLSRTVESNSNRSLSYSQSDSNIDNSSAPPPVEQICLSSQSACGTTSELPHASLYSERETQPVVAQGFLVGLTENRRNSMKSSVSDRRFKEQNRDIKKCLSIMIGVIAVAGLIFACVSLGRTLRGKSNEPIPDSSGSLNGAVVINTFENCQPNCDNFSETCARYMTDFESEYRCCSSTFVVNGVPNCASTKGIGMSCPTRMDFECQEGLYCASYYGSSDFFCRESPSQPSSSSDGNQESSLETMSSQDEQSLEGEISQDSIASPQTFGESCSVIEENCIQGMRCAKDVNDYHVCCVHTFFVILTDQSGQFVEEYCTETKSEGEVCSTGNDLECKRGYVCSEASNNVCILQSSVSSSSNVEDDILIDSLSNSSAHNQTNNNTIMTNSTNENENDIENDIEGFIEELTDIVYIGLIENNRTHCDLMQNDPYTNTNPVCESEEICATIQDEVNVFMCCEYSYTVKNTLYCAKRLRESCENTKTDDECEGDLKCVQVAQFNGGHFCAVADLEEQQIYLPPQFAGNGSFSNNTSIDLSSITSISNFIFARLRDFPVECIVENIFGALFSIPFFDLLYPDDLPDSGEVGDFFNDTINGIADIVNETVTTLESAGNGPTVNSTNNNVF